MVARAWSSLLLLLGIAAASLVLPPSALAQDDPAARARAIAAAVEIAFVADVTTDGMTTSQLLPVGSGTIVSPEGLILTNWHVVDLASFRSHMNLLEEQARSAGHDLRFSLEDQGVVILTSDGAHPPQPTYLAEFVSHDVALDLAVLRIVAHITDQGITAAVLSVPFLPLGDAATLSLGSSIYVYGYPAVGGDALTYTTGVVSGFNFETGRNEPAWITTDATLSGGSSGGAAVDSKGLLIGVPTQGSPIECQSVDSNQDGRLDEQDVDCLPIGGSIGQLRPITLALPLLTAAGLDRDGSPPRTGLVKSTFPQHQDLAPDSTPAAGG